MTKKFSNRKNSGQSLIITSLVVSLLIVAIVYGVFEANRINESRDSSTLNSHVSAVKLGLKNTVTSALVSVSNGAAMLTVCPPSNAVCVQ